MNDKLTMERICSEENINAALDACKRKKTVSGVDNMSATELVSFWEEYGEYIKKMLYQRSYCPMSARIAYIPKGDKKGTREIAILTRIDRMIQKAVDNILYSYFEELFHDNSYGYRKNRTTQDALQKVLTLLEEGYTYIASVDIEKYFDNVNHALLLSMLKQHIDDKRIMVLIKQYLKQEVEYGKYHRMKRKGIIQGAPLSPLFANLYLNAFDWHMDRLGIRFVRFADDILLFAKDEKEAEKIMKEAQEYLDTELLLKVNDSKSKICTPQQCEFLGFQIVKRKNGTYGLEVCQKNKQKMYRKLCKLINNMPQFGEQWWDRIGAFHRGWINYFCISERDSFIYLLHSIQRDEIWLLKQKIAQEKVKGNKIPEESFPRSRGFIFLLDWLPTAMRKKEGWWRSE